MQAMCDQNMLAVFFDLFKYDPHIKAFHSFEEKPLTP